jgi:uncharacterized protein
MQKKDRFNRFRVAVVSLFIAFPILINPLSFDWRYITAPCLLHFAYATDEPQFLKEGELIFLEKNGKKRITKIDIEIADTDYERTRGLMYRHSLPENAGMLFIFGSSEPRSFWMRNTYISLDIIFADEKKQIVQIYKKTTPLSYAAIQSKKIAKYVVEVNAGFSDNHGITVGDLIRF